MCRMRNSWRLTLCCALLICSALPVDAQPSPTLVSVSVEVPAKEAVLNNPPKTVSLVKRVVETLDPSYETIWTISDGTFSQGISASLYAIQSNTIHLASVRLGYGTGEKLYAGVGLDLPGLTKRFVPETIKGFVTAKPLDLIWSVVGKYARVTPIAGYSWGENKPMYGMAIGAALSF